MKRSVSLAVLMSLTTVSPGLYALGLAEPDVKSSLSEPLQAQIVLTDLGTVDPEHLVVQLADSEAFAQAGMRRSALAESVRMAVSRNGDELKVMLTTDRPVHEPYLDLLLTLTWPDGALRRQVTLLFDPPGYANTASLTGGSPGQAEVDQPDISVLPLPETASEQPPGVARTDRRLEVLPGDSLWRIAERIERPSGISIEQLVVALYRTNSDAFPGGNINSLRAGTMLDVPGPDAQASITDKVARRQLSSQYAAWQADSGLTDLPTPDNRQRLTLLSDTELEAEAALLSKSPLNVASVDAGAIGAGVHALGGVSETPDGLVKMGETLLASLEENRQASLDILQSLRAERDQLQKEIALLRVDMAALRSLLAEVSPDSPGVAESISAAATGASSEVTTPALVEADQEGSEKASQPTLWQGFWRGVSEQVVLMGGAVVVMLTAVWVVIRRRRYHEQHADDQAYPFPSAAMHGGGEQMPHVDEAYESVPASGRAVSSGEAVSQTDSAPQAEAISEADIFIAYGRYEQARDLVEKSLEDEPDRDDLRLKLLSIHVELGERDAAQHQADHLLAHAGQECREEVERLLSGLRIENETSNEGAPGLVAKIVDDVANEIEAVSQDVERIIDYEPPSLDPVPIPEYDELRQPNAGDPALNGRVERTTQKTSGFDESEWEIEEVAFEPLNLDNEQLAAGTSKTHSER